jgi:hypothetical protein
MKFAVQAENLWWTCLEVLWPLVRLNDYAKEAC